MPKNIINDDDRQGIRAALAGLSGARAKAEAQRWATLLDCHISRIYEITEDVRPARKKRTDSGKRRVDLDHAMVDFAAGKVIAHRIDPEIAIETTEIQPQFEGQKFPISLGTFRRLLRERGLDRQQRRRPVHPYRSWGAANPLDIFQFDITGLKERWWYDISNRRILHLNELQVSRNHPNENRNRVKVWSFHLRDDCSRFQYIRFVAVDKPNSTHVIEFLLECFRNLGIPLCLYTDNDPIIVSQRMKRAAYILNRAFIESGGFRLQQHTPGRPQATGKVESGHRIVEHFWNLISLKQATPDLSALNRLAANVCDRGNRRPHRATGVAPLLLFNKGLQPIRIPPPALLDSAFTAMPYRVAVAGNLTISVEGERYQLPRSQELRVGELSTPNPFLSLAGRRGETFKIDVVWPANADYFVAIVDKTPYELERILAVPDVAGEFKTMPESIGQRTEKIIRANEAQRRRTHKEAGTDIIVPGLDQPFAAQLATSQGLQAGAVGANTNIFPKKKIATNPELLAAMDVAIVPPSMVHGRQVNRWTAADQLNAEGLMELPLTSADKRWLDRIFAGRDEMLDTELRQLLADRVDEPAKIVEMRTA